MFPYVPVYFTYVKFAQKERGKTLVYLSSEMWYQKYSRSESRVQWMCRVLYAYYAYTSSVACGEVCANMLDSRKACLHAQNEAKCATFFVRAFSKKRLLARLFHSSPVITPSVSKYMARIRAFVSVLGSTQNHCLWNRASPPPRLSSQLPSLKPSFTSAPLCLRPLPLTSCFTSATPCLTTTVNIEICLRPAPLQK